MSSSSTPAAKAFIRQQVEVRAKEIQFWPLPTHVVNFMVADLEQKLAGAVGKMVTPDYVRGAFKKAEPTPETPGQK